jgi:hypothetical protein
VKVCRYNGLPGKYKPDADCFQTALGYSKLISSNKGRKTHSLALLCGLSVVSVLHGRKCFVLIKTNATVEKNRSGLEYLFFSDRSFRTSGWRLACYVELSGFAPGLE